MKDQKLNVDIPLRLLFFTGGSYVAGLEVVNLELMRELKDKGVPVHAVISGWNNGMFPKMLDAAGVPWTSIKLGAITGGNPLKVPLSWTVDGLRHAPMGSLALSRLCHEFRPTHLVHSDYRYAFVAVLLLGSRYHHVFYAHSGMGPRLTGLRGSFVVKRSKTIICCSDFVRQGILQAHPECSAKVVHNGCAAIRLSNRSGRETGSTLFGIVGQISPHKQIEFVARSIHKAKKNGIDCMLLIFGDDDNEYARDIRKQRYSGVEFMGFSDDRNKIYGEIDCLISAWDREPFGMTIIEAMSAGLPVIASDSGGPKEIILQDGTGLLFAPNDEENLIRCITRMSDPATRNRYGKSGKTMYSLKFSAEAMADGFLNALV